MRIDPKDVAIAALQRTLQHLIAPRPIALVSTVDNKGNVNLSPFSFFNLFSANPPVVIFSPARRVRDKTTKHTLDNVYEVRECVVNIVDYAMVSQAARCSADHPKGLSEFGPSGLTPVASERVAPPGVLESPARLECRVQHILPLGKGPGAGNLVIAEILLAHVPDDLGNLELVGRMGGDQYCRITPDNLFTLPKANMPYGNALRAVADPGPADRP